MTNWLLKSEPDEFSIADLKQKNIARWDGVRNYQARNFMAQMQPGDLAFFYHSSCKDIGIVGIMQVKSLPYPDPLAIDKRSDYFDEKALKENKWLAVDMAFHTQYPNVLKLAKIKSLALKDERLAKLDLLKKGSRLSVMPVNHEQWQCLIDACESN